MNVDFRQFTNDLFAVYGIKTKTVTPESDDIYRLDEGLRRDILGFPEQIFDEVRELLCEATDRTIYHFVDVFQCNYYIGRLTDKEDSLWIIGPIIFEKIIGSRFEQMFSSLKLSDQFKIPLQEYYYSVSYLSGEYAFEPMLLLIMDYYYGKDNYKLVHKDENTILHWKEFYDGYYRVPDEPFQNIDYMEKRYSYENGMVMAVRAGNEQEALVQQGKLAAVLPPSRLSNELRDMKDLSITLNTILRKAAESGGVHPIHIDSMSNGFVRQIEHITSIEQCKALQRRMVRHYCQLVKEYNLQEYSLPIRKVLTYIHTDLTADLSLKALSDQININASYLSSLFKKEVGISLTEYTNTSRITHAQILLYSTDLPIKTIALQCGISDMYYFSRMFKRITGITPKAYRDRNTSKKA